MRNETAPKIIQSEAVQSTNYNHTGSTDTLRCERMLKITKISL